jgi:hypothetical protein
VPIELQLCIGIPRALDTLGRIGSGDGAAPTLIVEQPNPAVQRVASPVDDALRRRQLGDRGFVLVWGEDTAVPQLLQLGQGRRPTGGCVRLRRA